MILVNFLFSTIFPSKLKAGKRFKWVEWSGFIVIVTMWFLLTLIVLHNFYLVPPVPLYHWLPYNEVDYARACGMRDALRQYVNSIEIVFSFGVSLVGSSLVYLSLNFFFLLRFLLVVCAGYSPKAEGSRLIDLD